MNIKKINEVKEFYSKKINTKTNNKINNKKPFFTKIMKKLAKNI